MITLKIQRLQFLIDRLSVGWTKYRLIKEIAIFLRKNCYDVYSIGKRFYDYHNKNSSLYDNPLILCRYLYVSITPLKSFQPLFEYVKNGKVLDYGSGIGICFDSIKNDSKYEKYFLDLPGPAFDFVKWKYKNYGYFLDVTNDSIGDDYDLIVITDVLEHVENPQAVLNEIINALKPSGFLLYYFHDDINKPGHLAESIKLKPSCDERIRNEFNFICHLKYIPQYSLWQKKYGSSPN